MTGPFSLSVGASLATVSQTLTRLANAADYMAHLVSEENVLPRADLWQEAVRDGDTERLIQDVRIHDALPIRHLDDESLELLTNLAFSDPQLRAELQTNAERLERSIGVALPLRMSVFAGTPPSGLPDRGIALFLGAREEAAVPARSALQLFTVTPPPASEDETLRISTPRKLKGRGRSAAVQEHFARKDIETIAARDLRGARVTPLSAPLEVALQENLTRIGRFTFLGLNRALTGDGRERLLTSIERYRSQVDVLVLGGLSAAEPSFADAALVTLKPRLALLPVAAAAAVHTFGYTTVFPVTTSSPATLELHPLLNTISVESVHASKSLPLKRQDRILDILEQIRPDVTRELVRSVYGEMTATEIGERSKGAWRWARLTMNGVVPMALRYLLLLDFDPNRFAHVPEREVALMRVIDEMTDPLGFRDTVPDHVWALKEILLRSGLLEPRG
ncbi:MAG TPA: hypothetical protein VLJ37_09600 [bacterium]|nr:hypothetical protein [bacterium]